jgi:hypothetical protein
VNRPEGCLLGRCAATNAEPTFSGTELTLKLIELLPKWLRAFSKVNLIALPFVDFYVVDYKYVW